MKLLIFTTREAVRQEEETMAETVQAKMKMLAEERRNEVLETSSRRRDLLGTLRRRKKSRVGTRDLTLSLMSLEVEGTSTMTMEMTGRTPTTRNSNPKTTWLNTILEPLHEDGPTMTTKIPRNGIQNGREERHQKQSQRFAITATLQKPLTLSNIRSRMTAMIEEKLMTLGVEGRPTSTENPTPGKMTENLTREMNGKCSKSSRIKKDKMSVVLRGEMDSKAKTQTNKLEMELMFEALQRPTPHQPVGETRDKSTTSRSLSSSK